MSGILISCLIIIILLLGVAVAFYGCNRWGRHLVYAPAKVFYAGSKVRNVDWLAIGELPDADRIKNMTGKSGGYCSTCPTRLLVPVMRC